MEDAESQISNNICKLYHTVMESYIEDALTTFVFRNAS